MPRLICLSWMHMPFCWFCHKAHISKAIEAYWTSLSLQIGQDQICHLRMVVLTSTFVCLFVCSGLTSLSTIFQSYHYGVWLWQRAHCHSAVSLKYHATDTLHDTTSSNLILTLGRPALRCKSECQVRTASTTFNNFGMQRTRIQSELYRGQYLVCLRFFVKPLS